LPIVTKKRMDTEVRRKIAHSQSPSVSQVLFHDGSLRNDH
jgi:hypothetical protein